MNKKTLTEKEWDKLVKDLLKSFVHSVLPNWGDNPKAAKALNMSLSAIEQMKSIGRGSPKTWIKLAAYQAGLSPNEIKSFFSELPTFLKVAKTFSEMDHLFEEIKKKYESQEVVALLQLLLAKREIEESLGINVKVSKKKKASKKTSKKK